MNEALMEIYPDIQSAARSVAFKWPTVTSEEDMTHDIVVRLLETPASVAKLGEMEKGARKSNLMRIGNQIAAAERDDFEVFSGQYRFSVEEVKEALGKGALKGNGSFDVQAVDIQEAMVELNNANSGQFKALVSRYLHGVVAAQGAGQMLLNRSLEHLTTILNRSSSRDEYDYSNGGRFRNNRLATNQVDLDYDGEGRFDE